MAFTYEPIATTTLGSATGTITFSGITSSYTDLRLILNVSSTSAFQLQVRMRFNGDTGTNYSYRDIAGNGASAFANSSSNVSYGQLVWYGTSNTVPTFYTVDVISYSFPLNKQVLITSSEDMNGQGAIRKGAVLWRSTSTINSIDLFTNSGTFSAGTTASLYGILRA